MDPAQKTALQRYRVMAYLVGVGLLALVLVGVPLQYAAGRPAAVQIIGPIHGFLYIVYLVTVADLARRFGLGLRQVIALVAAGFVPFLAFIVERWMTRRVTARPGGAAGDA
ncbi:MAG: DUF3817 domain-containing protein [Acidimicrobiales bacterium]